MRRFRGAGNSRLNPPPFPKMKTYSQFRPTQFDSHINLDRQLDGEETRENWLVAPVSRTRDSGALDQSNFESALQSLGGESETVEVHRFGHWGPGWYEIILIAPDSDAARIGEEIESALENYPVLDDEDYSSREHEEYLEAWDSRDFINALRNEFKLAYDTHNFLDELDTDTLRAFHESLIPSGEYYTPYSEGISIRTDISARNCTRDQLAAFIREQRNSAVPA